MRKSLFLTIVLSLCVADFGVFAATNTRGNARGGNNTATQQSAGANTGNAPVSARAGARQKVVNNGAKTTGAAPAGNVSARAGKKQTVVNNGAKSSSGQPMAARAGATQKVINTGTKVATAAENTSVPQECQDAFYGCMDAFCMLDNASGGRCQCNDKITELDKVLEDILKLDEQSYIMATEGVERIQMGEAEEAIMARAKAAGDKAANANKEAEENKKKSRTLDLSVFDNSIFNELDDDIFDVQSAQNSLLDKKGTALFNETTKMCSAQISAQCRSYGQMLSLVYAQKIKSDCIAYENSLKAQKNQSQQKLQTAQKALRDAALDEYKNQNKYSTTGECAIAFTQCMKTTAECGDDYTGCVTLAATENVKNGTKSGSVAKQTKIKGQVSGADITLAASTMESLLAKKEICAHITKQCVNSNKNDAVWNVFLRNAAPALKSAELIAEQNLRSNCIPTVAKCFTDACKSKFGENDESYDMCLSNPATYKALCKVQLEPCLEATGGTYEKAEDSSLWNGLVAMLNSMKVDACTKEVKDCLLSEDRCGADYAGCIGLDTQTIADMCPVDKLTACVSNGNYADGKGGTNTTEIRAYVAEVAQGLALQIDNSLATVCQNAAQEAMIKACGDAESCENANFDLSSLESAMTVKICKEGATNETDCESSLAMIENAELVKRNNGYHAVLFNAPDISSISFEDEDEEDNDIKKLVFTPASTEDDTLSPTQQSAKIMQEALQRIMNQINSDPKVVYCREGREVQGFKLEKNLTGKNNPRYPNLTYEFEQIIANSLMGKLSEKNLELTNKFNEQMAEIDKEIAERIYAKDEEGIDESNKIECAKKNTKDSNRCETWSNKSTGRCCCGNISAAYTYQLTENVADYDAETNICVVKTMQYTCVEQKYGFFWFGNRRCVKYDSGTVLNTQNLQLGKSH